MTNGFILAIFQTLVRLLVFLNPAEWVKNIGAKIHGVDGSDGQLAPRGYAVYNVYIDIFVVLKWLLLIAAILMGWQCWLSAFVIWYLVFFNAFGFFYYHGWRSGFSQRQDLESQRRRFLNLIQAIAFYLVAYAYLFQFHYVDRIGWPDEAHVAFADAFYLSVANAFTLTYPGFEPLDRFIRMIFLTELANTFLFFTVLIGSSVPDGVGPKTGNGSDGANDG